MITSWNFIATSSRYLLALSASFHFSSLSIVPCRRRSSSMLISVLPTLSPTSLFYCSCSYRRGNKKKKEKVLLIIWATLKSYFSFNTIYLINTSSIDSFLILSQLPAVMIYIVSLQFYCIIFFLLCRFDFSVQLLLQPLQWFSF